MLTERAQRRCLIGRYDVTEVLRHQRDVLFSNHVVQHDNYAGVDDGEPPRAHLA